MKKCIVLAAFAMMLTAVSAFAQEKITVSGVVTDNQNVPMIGVSVIEVGTTNGVSTDVDGKYSISVTRGGY